MGAALRCDAGSAHRPVCLAADARNPQPASPANPAPLAPAPPVTLTLDLKSTRLSALMLPLRSRDFAAVAAAARHQWGVDAGFEGEPLVLDLRELPATGAPVLDWLPLLQTLRELGLQAVAMIGADALQDDERQAALAAGLHASSDTPARTLAAPAPPAPAAQAQAVPAKAAETAEPAPVPTSAARCLVVERSLRSGQQVYARDADLVVLGLVSHGAEVIADGSVHVYGALRGRAIAGAKGDANARIYAQSLEAELLAVAGTFRTSEKPLPADVAGRPAQVRLDGERLVFEPLSY
ncbi:MAG: septum site-determining protein MinC [Burkholderiales bacterium]|nr:septum site-determining protein MinC [Burkholderiales bacterium]